MEAHDCNWFHFAYSRGARCINDRCPLHRAMRTLAENLRWAGALCAAYEVPRWRWEPGCGREAPGWRGE